MMRMIAFSLLCITAFYIYRLLKKRVQKMLQGGYCGESKPNRRERGTLVKDPCTGEYYVR
ncbi:hypothetical protein BVtw_04280 [Bartonella vinsonii subsp. berkhoffii str. Tweed]|uniref:Uncharacterized protein n=1 Tax=Bartonella vinsonii subsp. berkhoffii str. Tweed TaxID=1094502 RepID=N6VVK7_BARVB|nr:hypothetical protein BVwin_03190 [Bartonella vinsonii subsp. berkhoffii str. Winnie]ENN95152.1 hypothetical protein BVtw_04280 [Bartonella vinsonii subsp. berkhoffii str. Tweed]